MEEEKILKQKYNDLLESLKIGEDYVIKNPSDEKAKKRLEEIGEEIKNIMKLFPNMTANEMENGFIIPQNNEQNKAPIKNESIVAPSPLNNKPIVVEKQNNINNDFENNWNVAVKLSKSSLLPDEFKGKPENTIIALGMSQKMGMDFFTIAQNLHIIRGKLSWSGAFCKTLIEQSGKYTDLDFVYFGKEGTDERGCYLEATRIRDLKRIQGNKVTVKLAKDEKWYNTNSKWRTMTDQMLGYRAAAFFARLYCGEMLNGIMTTEENVDMNPQRPQPQDIL